MAVERRLAITYSVTAMTTLGIACIAIATVGGGIFASAAPRLADGGTRQIEYVDDFIVLHTSTTTVPTTETVALPAGTPAAQPAATARASKQSPAATIAA